MKVAIVGSRDFPGLHLVRQEVEGLHQTFGDRLVIVSGGARGVDRYAADTAMRRGVPVVEYRVKEFEPGVFRPEKWDWTPGEGWKNDELSGWSGSRSFGRVAFARNRMIADHADRCHAFWDGESKGTRHTMDLFGSMAKPLLVRYAPGVLKESDAGA